MGRSIRKYLPSGRDSSKGEPRSIGRPAKWSRADVIRAVFKLCKGRYVKANEFPTYLYKLCRAFCGSVRAAKWECRILKDPRSARRK